MKLRIEFPVISPAIEGGVIVQWHKAVGDPIAYGDDLYDVAIDEVIRIRRRLGASVRMPGKVKYRKLTDVSVRYRVSSMDSGTLDDITAPEGASVHVGDDVGSMVAPGEIHDEAPRTARVAANVLEPGSI